MSRNDKPNVLDRIYGSCRKCDRTIDTRDTLCEHCLRTKGVGNTAPSEPRSELRYNGFPVTNDYPRR